MYSVYENPKLLLSFFISFCMVLLGHFIKNKPLISEEWQQCRFGQQRLILSSSGDHNGHPNVNACIINIVVLVVFSVIRVLNNEKYYSSKNLHHIPPRPKMKQGVFRIWQPFLKGSDKQTNRYKKYQV